MIVAVLAGGRGSRMGGAEATATLAGEPLIARPLRAARAAGLDAVVVAKPGTELPPLDVPVWLEPETPFHPLVGVVAALQHGPVIAVACDQPWVPPELLRALADHDGPALAAAGEPFPGRYEPSQLPVLREALAAEASLRKTLARLAPPTLGARPELLRSLNTLEALAAAEATGDDGERGAICEAGEQAVPRAVAAARRSPDVAVIGGGIVGCALAAFLAEGGARVVVYEREAIAAGASGRNSGVVQDTLDPELAGLYEESLEHYRTLGHGFELPAEPSGLLLVSDGPLEPHAGAEYFEGAALRALEPSLADGLAAYRFETGRPVPPAAAAHAFAARAREAGAEFVIANARPEDVDAGAVAVAAGPWTGELLDLPIRPIWGVVVEFELPDAPTHVLEEAGIDVLTSDAGLPETLFSAVTARGISAIGSTFLDAEPDPHALAPRIVENAARFLPALTSAKRRGLRACARPGSPDGRPLLGMLRENLAVASGHGAWGVTLGPASARLVADQLLGRPVEIPPALQVTRF